VQFQPHIWLTRGRRLQGTLSGVRRVIADATWVPCAKENRIVRNQSARDLAAWLDQPRDRLPQPLGFVHGEDALLILAPRCGGRALADLAPLPASAALSVVAAVLDSVGAWFRDQATVPLAPSVLDAWSTCLCHDGSLHFTHLLPGETPLRLEQALTAVGNLLTALREGATDHHSDDAEACRLLIDGLTSTEEPQISLTAAVQEMFDLHLHPDALQKLADEHAIDLGPHGGDPHPWHEDWFEVQHWRLPDAPDRTGELHPRRPVEDRYAVRSLIAQGGMGRILSVWDPELQREVALKVLYEDGTEDRSFVARFLREIRVTARLSHPAIVPVYSLETTEAGTPAFTMKHIEGQTFHDYLRVCVQQHREGKLDDQHALPARLEHFVKVCDAVAYAHSRGILHRDLKIENLMVGSFHEVYVMDWGVARTIEEDGPQTADGEDSEISEITQVGDIVGTETYMSPEQARGHHDSLTPASDQFSLGLVLYELATLLRARATDEPDIMLAEARAGTIGTLADLDDQPLPAGLCAIIERATQLRPEDRYADVNLLAEDVRRFLTNRELSVLPDAPLARLWRRMALHPAHSLNVLAFTVSIAVVIAAASLAGSLRAQVRATAQVGRVAEVVATVARTSRDIDRQLQRHELLVDGMARQFGRLAQDEAARPLVLPRPADLRIEQEQVLRSARRRQLVDFTRPIAHLAPGTDPARIEQLTGRLGPAGELLRLTALRSLAPQTLGDPLADQLEALQADDGLLAWTLIGFEDGLFLSYPAHETLPATYDPRERPWYLHARDAHEVVWNTPHNDSAGTGMLLAASAAVRDDAGALLGVAAMELELGRLIEELKRIDVPGLRRVQVVDPAGVAIIDTEASPDGEPAALELEAVLVGIAAKATQGLTSAGDALVAYDRLTSLDWTLVVRMDRATVLEGAP
jgi:serine/threonine protein kinase